MYVLVHSPLVGPRTWTGVAKTLERRGQRVAVPSLLGMPHAIPAHWRWCADRILAALEPERGPLVLVGHSGAGALLPVVGVEAARPIRAYVFVDATIPSRTSATTVTPREFIAFLEAKAEDGRLPKWSRWWGDDAMRSLVPDEALRRELEDEMPTLPLSYFRETVPVPDGWPGTPCAYLQFSVAYDAVARDAASRGWRTRRVAGEHLHMVVDPGSVADAIVDLVGS